MRLANKTALITGGNSGIGFATAKLFVAEGAKVVITGRNQATLDAAARELGPNALAIVADATDIAATEAAIGKGAEKFGKYDIVFANAGIAGGTPLGSATVEAFEKVISTNLTSVFFTVQSALPYLNDNASIVLNGSVISVLGNPGYSAYGAAKAGVRAMARIMASELSPRGIRVNVVSPGAIRTPIWGAAIATPEAETDRADDAARPHRRTRPHLEDGLIPRLGRCRACAGPGIVRRRWCDGVSEWRADLSGVRQVSAIEIGRRIR
jgi:NAD(P)-dependent dehydrogenase (short-subunit alcohol dehydrogenase family)